MRFHMKKKWHCDQLRLSNQQGSEQGLSAEMFTHCTKKSIDYYYIA